MPSNAALEIIVLASLTFRSKLNFNYLIKNKCKIFAVGDGVTKRVKCQGGSEMVNKNRNQDMYAMWYDLSNEIGKQFFEISDIGNMNYANLQEFWNEYSKRMGQQIYELMILDKDSYKGMLTLWEDFKDQMNTQISYITNFKDNNYIQWYEKWLDYTDRIKKEFTEVI